MATSNTMPKSQSQISIAIGREYEGSKRDSSLWSRDEMFAMRIGVENSQLEIMSMSDVSLDENKSNDTAEDIAELPPSRARTDSPFMQRLKREISNPILMLGRRKSRSFGDLRSLDFRQKLIGAKSEVIRSENTSRSRFNLRPNRRRSSSHPTLRCSIQSLDSHSESSDKQVVSETTSNFTLNNNFASHSNLVSFHNNNESVHKGEMKHRIDHPETPVASENPFESGTQMASDNDDSHKISEVWMITNDKNVERRKRTRIFLYYAAVCLCVGIILLTCLFVGGPIGAENVQNIREDTSARSSQPSKNFSSVVTEKQKLTALLLPFSPILQDLSVAYPQHKAFSWLMSQNIPFTSKRIIQRYILATFYFSTNGKIWKTNNWLSDGNECDWMGVQCKNESVVLLDLKETGLEGSIPSEIGTLKDLEELQLHGNTLNGEIPVAIVQLPKLRKLYLNNNQISGTIPVEIGVVSLLETVDLSNNEMHGTIPNGFGNLENLSYLNLSNNGFTDGFPIEIVEMKNLETLIFNNNKIGGTVPHWIDSLESLRILQLSGNELFGSIPPEIGKLNNLEVLSLNNNAMHGTLPSSLGNLSFLRNLILNNNMFSGTIPDSFLGLANLEKLFLEKNKLFGSIPNWLGELIWLGEVKMEANFLTGVVLQSMCDMEPDTLSCDCGGRFPKINCSCCTSCFAGWEEG